MHTAQSPPSNAPPHLYAFDALRAIAVLGVVYAHSTMSFLFPFWVGIRDASSDRLARLILHESIELIHCFVLPLFFMVAGFFARRSTVRHGVGRMFRDRVRRVLLPFLVAVATVVPLLKILQQIGQSQANHTSAQIGAFIAQGGPWREYGPHYLWFLYFLMIYFAIAALLCRIAPSKRDASLPASKTIADSGAEPCDQAALASRVFRWLCRSGWSPLILTIPTLAVIGCVRGPIVAEVGRHFFAQPPLLVMYGLYFLFGWWLNRVEDCLPELARSWKSHLIGGLIVWVAGTSILLAFHTEETDFRIPHAAAGSDAGTMPEEPSADAARSPVFPVYPFLKAYLGWSLTLGLMGLALEKWTRPRPAVRYLADASYWIYLAHAPLLMTLQIAAAKWPIPWWIKLGAMNVFVVGILLLAYPYVVRSTALLLTHRETKPGKAGGS